MVISFKHRFIFFAVPKTGSTSIQTQLLAYGDKGNVTKHITPQTYHVHFAQYPRPIPWEDMLKIAFVRNPWDRMVSFYSAFRRNEPEQTIEFKDFIELPETRQVMQSQLSYTQGVDFVGRFENIDEDWWTVSRKLGIEYVKLEKINASEHPHYIDLYDEELCARVAELYKDEIKEYGYTFSNS